MTQAAILAASGSPGTTTGFKNRLINGGMVIDQRNAGASGTAVGFTVDRWNFSASATTKGTWQQNAGSVTPPANFTNYLGFTSNSAYTVAASEQWKFFQPIEGYNIADLGWGTANAKTITISFWVRSSLTGTFGGALTNATVNRSYAFTYTISAANTWEQKSVTIAGDTSGTWNTTNGAGVYVQFGMGVGSDYSGAAGSWASAYYASATGATSIVGTSGATFYITGVQFEVGTTATNFDFRPYGTELQLCYRYAQLYGSVSGASTWQIVLPYGASVSSTEVDLVFTPSVPMRATPSTSVSNLKVFDGNTGGSNITNLVMYATNSYNNTLYVYSTGTSGLTAYKPYYVRTISTDGYLLFSAEI